MEKGQQKSLLPNLQQKLDEFDRFPTLTFIPFSDQEAKVFWGDNQTVEVKNYKPLTDYPQRGEMK